MLAATDTEGSANKKSGEQEQSTKKRSAGFWSVFFMVVGVQFGGLSTVWNLGATEGLKKLFLGHALVGLMYVLLAICFAELTSVVPFAGGSFGFCRAALGPFWGFMVGASEVLENIMKVVVCVFLISLASTSVFETKESLQLVWILLCYLSLFVIHLRGGAVYWAAIIILGLISIGTVLMFCIGNTKDIDVKLYGQIENSSFEGHGDDFLGSLYMLIWVYIGLEIVPQTCERVKNVHKNLPRALVLGTLLTYGFIFWVIVAVACNAPGYLYPAAWLRNPYPFSIGFVMMFDTPDFLVYGPLFAIIPLFASALTFMWGCGYQVASLARSGLLPSVFATTYGENETPVVALGVSSLVQFLMCVIIQRKDLQRGLKTCYTTMMIGATFVYIGMFASFIVFRVRFSGMKRHWVSPVGIPGALVGMGMSIVLCIAVIILNPYNKATTTYFVFMGGAAIYYVLYARYTQYFSKEEQQQFLKAYILNANKSKSKHKTAQQKAIEAMFAPINRILSLPSSAFSKSHNAPSSASMMSSASKHSGQSSVGLVSKHNAVAPAPAPASTSKLAISTSRSYPSKADDEVRLQEPTHGTPVEPMLSSTTTVAQLTMANPRGAPLRASWAAASGSTKVGWSGKAMTMTESKKFLEVLMSAPEDVTSQLVESLPNQFVSLGVDEAAMASIADATGGEGKEGDRSEDREVLLGEIVEGALEDKDDA